jgi:hypothetical protein
MFRTVLIAAVLIATPVFAQQQSGQAVDGNFVMHIAANPDRTARVSFGMFRGGAVVQRRELGAQCAWNAAADLPARASDLVPIRVPANTTTPEEFGSYVGTLYSATAAHKGAQPNVEQLGCVRGLITAMAANAQRQGQAARPPATNP